MIIVSASGVAIASQESAQAAESQVDCQNPQNKNSANCTTSHASGGGGHFWSGLFSNHTSSQGSVSRDGKSESESHSTSEGHGASEAASHAGFGSSAGAHGGGGGE